MKKIVLFIALAFIALNLNAQTTWDFTGDWSINAETVDANLQLDGTTRFNYVPASTLEQLVFSTGTPISETEGLKFTQTGGSKIRLGFGTGLLYLNGGNIEVEIPAQVGNTIVITGKSASNGQARGFTATGGALDFSKSANISEDGLTLTTPNPEVEGGNSVWYYTVTEVPFSIKTTAGVNLLKINVEVQSFSSFTFWNFSDDIWEVKDYTEATTIEELTIVGAPGSVVAIDANNKTIDDYSFTKRLKLGGGGAPAEGTFLPTVRYLSFQVQGDATITMYGMSSSNGANRTIIVSDGENKIGTFVDDQSGDGNGKIKKGVVTYTGGATTIYLYSESSGFNLYAIKVTTGCTGIKSVGNASKAVKSVEYYDLMGRRLKSAESIVGTVLIEKTTYTDGTSSSSKMIKVRK